MGDSQFVPDDLPRYAPVRLLLTNPAKGWDGVSVRRWHFQPVDQPTSIPALVSFAILAYQRGSTQMDRLLDGHWQTESIGPGDISIMSAGAESFWRWQEPLNGTHVYLTSDLMIATCRDMYQQDVGEVRLEDTIKMRDPAIFRAALLLAAEAATDSAGSRILVDSLATEMCVRLLRSHGETTFKEAFDAQALSTRQQRDLSNYINDNIGEELSLQDVADHIDVSRSNLSRKFRAATGTSVHRYILEQRIERAETLLRRTTLPMHIIAAQCGFTDASHMNRTFRRTVGMTPGQYRAQDLVATKPSSSLSRGSSQMAIV